MSIIHSTAPAHAFPALTQGIADFASRGALAPFLSVHSGLGATQPHPVYVVHADDIAAGSLLSAARLVGWRYLLTDGGVPVAAAELESTPTGLKLVRLNRGPLVEGTVEGLRFAAPRNEMQTADYEVRFLTSPGVFLYALWLHGERDLIMPIWHGHSVLQTNTFYAEPDVVAALRPIAQSAGPSVDDQET